MTPRFDSVHLAPLQGRGGSEGQDVLLAAVTDGTGEWSYGQTHTMFASGEVVPSAFHVWTHYNGLQTGQ